MILLNFFKINPTIGRLLLCAYIVLTTYGAVMAPPWANPKLNPCASQPGGWQLLYWPPDGKCYKIFKLGYPCQDDMELSPVAMPSGKQELAAECRCPPKTAQSASDGRCYDLFSPGPCEKGQYFAPDLHYSSNSSAKRRWGVCVQLASCKNINELFWPHNGKCYEKLTKGPCQRGQLLTLSSHRIPTCKCNNKHELSEYWSEESKGCYQHFTRGPCREKGHLFLPDRTCGCHNFLPHYHEDSEQCFEIGTIGPCSSGEHFQMDPTNRRGSCQCKQDYVRYENDSTCYRPYTQGPCESNHIFLNSTTCMKQPCGKGHLYFPEAKSCHRIGSRGPCKKGQVVMFDFNTRPSVDGISYNGVCGCERGAEACIEEEVCDRSDNMVLFKHKCYKLYTQGPCVRGAWLVPRRHKKGQLWVESGERKYAYCECMPGYTRRTKSFNGRNSTECLSPTVILADYLNRNFIVPVVQKNKR